jgi:hypothetical protein
LREAETSKRDFLAALAHAEAADAIKINRTEADHRRRLLARDDEVIE